MQYSNETAQASIGPTVYTSTYRPTKLKQQKVSLLSNSNQLNDTGI